MGELRAYVLPAGALAALLGAGPEQRERVLALVGPALAPARPPALGPIFTRVPGTPVLHEDDPGPSDVDLLLAGAPVPPDRERAVRRVLEAVVAGLASSSTRTAAGRPLGLTRWGPPVREDPGWVAGTWTPAQARGTASLRPWLDGLEKPEDHEVVVVWSARPTR